MKVAERYASAVKSSDLKSEERTTYSDADVLGAYGLAAKTSPLAVALERLFAGDNGAAREIVVILAALSWGKAKSMRLKQTRVQSEDMARAVLAWHRDGVCTACGGHGYEIIHGAPTIGATECKACAGTGKLPFEKQFHADARVLARWLLTHVEREQSFAGQAAMRALAPRLEL